VFDLAEEAMLLTDDEDEEEDLLDVASMPFEGECQQFGRFA
jgi:hypothetical protein